MTTQALSFLDPVARANCIAHGAVFITSALLMYGALQDSQLSLAIVGALFLIASAMQLFSKADKQPSKLVSLFTRHARHVKIAMFAGAAALVWSAVQEQKAFAAITGTLLLVAIAYDLFRRKA